MQNNQEVLQEMSQTTAKRLFDEIDTSVVDQWARAADGQLQEARPENGGESEPQVWSFLDAAAAIATSVKRTKTSCHDASTTWSTPVIDQPPQINSEVLLSLLGDGNLGFANTKFFAPPPEEINNMQSLMSRRWSSPGSDISSPGSSTSSLCSSPMSTASFLDDHLEPDYSLVDNLIAGFTQGESAENRTVDSRIAMLNASASSSPYVDPATYDESQNQFRLVYPLNAEQRKSYHRENRYLAPNPIIIGPKDDSFTVETGVVSVELVDERGMPVAQEHSARVKYLESSPPDQMKRWIHSKEPSAKFTLKIMENSGPTRFRLKFLVDYVLQDGTTVSEVVFSNAFIVHYNKKRKGSFSQPNSLQSSTDSLTSYSDVFSPDFLGSFNFQ